MIAFGRGGAAAKELLPSLSQRYGPSTLHAWLVQPVHASTVGMMRIFFSVCMYWQAQHFSDVFDEFLTSKQVFPYPGLGWVAPCGPALGRAILRTNSIAAVMTGAGVLTKPATLVLFLTFTYVFLLCESNHNNHYILICHVTFVASALDWGRYASVDAVAAHFWRRWTDRADKDKAVVARPEEVATVPYWNLLLLQLLFSIPCAARPFPAQFRRRDSGAIRRARTFAPPPQVLLRLRRQVQRGLALPLPAAQSVARSRLGAHGGHPVRPRPQLVVPVVHRVGRDGVRRRHRLPPLLAADPPALVPGGDDLQLHEQADVQHRDLPVRGSQFRAILWTTLCAIL